MGYRTRILAVPLVLLACSATAQQRALKPGFNLFSKEQDIQMGKEYAAQVEQQMPIVRNAELEAYLQKVGRKLATQPEAGNFPYTFKLVQEKSINAFALPGGPTFVNTGLITAAENEGQLAGVMAHEIAHVALRHGTNQASKAQLWQLPAMLAGSMLGNSGSLVGTLAQIGIGLGTNSILLKYSRNAERDADLLGARIMSNAGYNPIEMARFFEKLEAETGKGNAFTNFLSDHPNPGDRVKAVQEEIRYLPQRKYTADTNELPKTQKAILGLPELPKRHSPGQSQSSNTGNPDMAASRPSGRFKQFQGREVAFQYPDNWQVHGEQGSDQVTVVPDTALFGQQLGYAMMVNFAEMPRNTELRAANEKLLTQIRKENPSMKLTQAPRLIKVNNYPGAVTRLESDSPYSGAREVDLLVAIERPGGLFYIVFIAPDKEYPGVQRVFEQILQSLRFAN